MSTPAEKQDREDVNILLVDDQKKNLIALEAILEEPGVNLVTALSGQVALNKMLEHEFALVIMDVQMPGMDGFECARLMRGTRRTMDVPIIFVTAISKEQEYVFKGYEAGAVDYMFKPVEPDILRSKTKIFIDLYEKNRALKESIHDLTETREALADQARELQRSNRDLERFAYLVSHDLKEPLRAVHSFLEMIDDTYHNDLDEAGHKMIQFALNGSKRMWDTIDSLLHFSQVTREPPTFESVDCNSLLDEVLDDLRVLIEEEHAKVTRDALHTVQADPTQIKQVLQNLVNNGIKFHGNHPPEVHISSMLDPQEGRVVLSVTDHGIGIPSHNLEKIFQIFHRLDSARNVEGTGIGLAICKTIIQKHGGDIWVESDAGKGTRVLFSLEPAEAMAS